MATYKIFKETAVPASLEPNGIYLITDSGDSDYLEIYVTNNLGSVTRRLPTRTDIEAIVAAELSGGASIEVVADIAERGTLTPTSNVQVLVLDASADNDVGSGAATYVWHDSASTWRKISEAESLDLSLTWASIVGGPSSTPTQIDTAVTNSHTHPNKTQLDEINEDADQHMTYRGNNVALSGSITW